VFLNPKTGKTTCYSLGFNLRRPVNCNGKVNRTRVRERTTLKVRQTVAIQSPFGGARAGLVIEEVNGLITML
jgi:hypothetical protein